jgi:hypothetical protein
MSLFFTEKSRGAASSHKILLDSWGMICRRLARVAFGLAIVFAPLRLYFTLASRAIKPIYNVYTDLIVYPLDICIVLVLIFWGSSYIFNKRKLLFGPLFLTLPLFGLLLTGLISAVFSVDPIFSFYQLIRFVSLLGIYFFVMNEIYSVNQITWAVLGSIFIQASIGIVQVLDQTSIGFQSIGELLLDPTRSETSIAWSNGIRSLRAYALSDHPNILAGILVFSLILLITAFIKRKSKENLTLIYFSVLTLGAVCLILTFSISAWISLVAAISWMIFMLWRVRQVRLLERIAILFLASIILLLPIIWVNASLIGATLFPQASIQTETAAIQTKNELNALNQAANEIFSAHAVVGVGLGTFPIALHQFFPNFGFYFQPPHFVLLEVAAELGIFGAVFYFSLLLAPWLAMWFYRKRFFMDSTLIGASAALLAISMIGFMDYYPWFHAAGLFWQWILWGIWARAWMGVVQGNYHD